MEFVRSFIAIELPEPLRRELEQLQLLLKLNKEQCVKKVDALSIHLTLKFLGAVDADKLETITGAIQKACENTAPFKLEVREVGAFPNLRRPQVLWVGMTGEIEILKKLQEEIDLHLIPLNFTPEEREFTPHLTLARVRMGTAVPYRQRLGELIARTPFAAATPVLVDAVSLMRSELTPKGAIYSRISRVMLK